MPIPRTRRCATPIGSPLRFGEALQRVCVRDMNGPLKRRSDRYPSISHLYETFALKLAHHLRDGFASGHDHVCQVLMRQAHVEYGGRAVGLPETVAEVRKQRSETRRYFPF